MSTLCLAGRSSQWKFIYTFLLSTFICWSDAVIYRLNDTEYDRMPALFGLDQYHSCLRREDGVYCMLRLDLHAEHTNQLMNLIKGYSEHTVKHFDYTYLQRGVCVPTTCRHFLAKKTDTLTVSADLDVTLERCLNESIYREYGIQAKLTAVYYCDTHNSETKYDALDWIVAVIFLIIFAVNIIGSYYDVSHLSLREKNCKGSRILSCFSLFENWKCLTTYEPMEPRKENLKGLHCVKNILQTFVVMAHCTWINTTFTDNPGDFEKMYDTWYYHVIHGGMMLVQIFFVLSAFLSTYIFLIEEQADQVTWSTFPKIIMSRFCRLTPAYAAVLALSASWLRHAGDGPLWQLECGGIAGACRRHAWSHLLYFNNYVEEDKICALHTWYLATDFQLFVLCVAVMVSTRARWRPLVLSQLLLLGLVLPACHVWLQNLDGAVIMEPEFFRSHNNPTYHLLHTTAHGNILFCVAGMGTALLAHHMQTTKADYTKNKIFHHLCWLVVPAVVVLFASCSVFYGDGERASLPLRVMFAVVSRVAMATVTSFMILALVMRWNEHISRLCEWDGWRVAGRLSYCVYLVHLNLVHMLLARRTSLSHVSMYNLGIVTLGVNVASLLLAMLLYLLVDAPAARFFKSIILEKFTNVRQKTA